MSAELSFLELGMPKVDFKIIYKTFCDRVYRVALQITRDAHLAEDVMQETFIKAYNKWDTIIDIEKIGAWLSTIASRTAIDFIRKEKRVGILPIEDMDNRQYYPESENHFAVDKEVERHWMEQEMNQEIDDLAPCLKEVFVLKYKSGYKEKDIAKYLQLPNGTVKSRLYRARQQLKTGVNRPSTEIV